MKRFIVLALLVLVMTMVFAIPASADNDPCGGDGKHYAEHHISFLAQEGNIGGGGHVPGTAHQGFSACDPSG